MLNKVVKEAIISFYWSYGENTWLLRFDYDVGGDTLVSKSYLWLHGL